MDDTKLTSHHKPLLWPFLSFRKISKILGITYLLVMCGSTGGRLTPSVSDCTIEKSQSRPVRASLFSL